MPDRDSLLYAALRKLGLIDDMELPDPGSPTPDFRVDAIRPNTIGNPDEGFLPPPEELGSFYSLMNQLTAVERMDRAQGGPTAYPLPPMDPTKTYGMNPDRQFWGPALAPSFVTPFTERDQIDRMPEELIDAYFRGERANTADAGALRIERSPRGGIAYGRGGDESPDLPLPPSVFDSPREFYAPDPLGNQDWDVQRRRRDRDLDMLEADAGPLGYSAGNGSIGNRPYEVEDRLRYQRFPK